MILSDFMTAVNDALRGTDEDTPLIGSTDWLYWGRVLNRKKNELYQDTSKQWNETYRETPPTEPGTVATTGTTTLTGTSTKFNDYRAGDKITVSGETVRTIDAIASDTSLTVTVAFSNTDSALPFTRQTLIASGIEAYSLHRSFLAPSETCYVLDTDSQRHYFDIIKPEERDDVNQEVFVSDENPKVLNFTQEVESTFQYVGGTLYLPGLYMPDDVVLTLASSIIPLPDPYWGVMSVASEIAGNDLSYEDKEANLVAKANNLYSQMTRNNRRGSFGNPRQVPTRVTRIPDTRNRYGA
jgi:hypothetical protein